MSTPLVLSLWLVGTNLCPYALVRLFAVCGHIVPLALLDFEQVQDVDIANRALGVGLKKSSPTWIQRTAIFSVWIVGLQLNMIRPIALLIYNGIILPIKIMTTLLRAIVCILVKFLYRITVLLIKQLPTLVFALVELVAVTPIVVLCFLFLHTPWVAALQWFDRPLENYIKWGLTRVAIV